jgi:CBS domain-containing protein
MSGEGEAFVPVVRSKDNPRLVGIITARDIAVRCVARHQARTCRVMDHMTPQPLFTAGPDDDITAIYHEMETAGVRRIPIVSDDGMLLGIVTESDVRLTGRERRPEVRAPRPVRALTSPIVRAD